jgi:small ligand-binding sensory domain FIST
MVLELDHAEELPTDADTLAVFADPYTLEAERLLAHADRLGIDIVGGFTGGYGAGSARLLTRDGVRTAGAVAIRFDLPGVQALVSQGARPIGNDLVITAAEGNVVLELAGKPAAEQLHAVLGTLSPEDLQLARAGLMAGIVIDENRPEYDVGDFLVRGLLGVAADSGGLAVAAEPRVGQTFRFHVRDGDGADHDLRRVLGAARPTVGAALIFACNGRGRHMFEAPHHDANVVAELLDVPLVGGFCQGELGPVAGANHVHAFTATMLTLPL